MKFGKNIAIQQAKFSFLRYIDYKGLKKGIRKDGDLLVFGKALDDEIESVNACFSTNVAEIQAALGSVVSEMNSGSSHTQVSSSLKKVMRIAEQVETLRRFAVWNAVAVVKILKKQTKAVGGLGSVGSSEWLSKQMFFSGSDFAELQATLESVASTVCRERLVELSGKLSPELQVDDQIVGGFFSNERCPICLEKCIDAVELSLCGHRFCWKCVVLGPIAYAPGEYRLSRCSVCRNELPLDPTRNFKTVCSNQLELLVELAEKVDEEVVAVSVCSDKTDSDSGGNWYRGLEEVFGSTGFARRSQTIDVNSEKNRQTIDTLDYSSGNHPSTFFCSLCCEPLLLEAVSTTPCKHHFHRVCLEKNATPICPLCDLEIPKELAVPRYLHTHLEQLGNRWKASSTCTACIPAFPDGPCTQCKQYTLNRLPPLMLFGPNGLEMHSFLHEHVHTQNVIAKPIYFRKPTYFNRFGEPIESFSNELIARKKIASRQFAL